MKARKLLLDEDSSGETLSHLLRESGMDTVTVYEVGLERTNDAAILEWAARDGRVVVTANKLDFTRLAADWSRSGRFHAGIVIRYPNQAPAPVSAVAILAALDATESTADLVMWASAGA